eukprot:1763918-Rhodomonas_salina.2
MLRHAAVEEMEKTNQLASSAPSLTVALQYPPLTSFLVPSPRLDPRLPAPAPLGHVLHHLCAARSASPPLVARHPRASSLLQHKTLFIKFPATSQYKSWHRENGRDGFGQGEGEGVSLSLIHISEPTRPRLI